MICRGDHAVYVMRYRSSVLCLCETFGYETECLLMLAVFFRMTMATHLIVINECCFLVLIPFSFYSFGGSKIDSPKCTAVVLYKLGIP